MWFIVIVQKKRRSMVLAGSCFTFCWQGAHWLANSSLETSPQVVKTCQNTPSPLLEKAARFQPVHRNDPCLRAKRPATSGSPLQLTLSLGWSLAITTMVYKSLAGANRTMLRRTEGKSSIYRWFLHYKSTICVQNQSHTNHFFGWPSRQGLEWHSREHSWRREHQAHCTGRPRGKCYWSGASDSNEFGLKIRHLSWLKLVNAQNNLCDSHLSYGWCLTTYINQPIWYTYMCYARVC